MELIVTSFIAFSIVLFVFKELVMLYFNRSKCSGLLLESLETSFYPNKLPASLRLLDVLLILSNSLTLLLYMIFMYERLAQTTIVELQFIDVGAAILLFNLMPTRKIFCALDEQGLRGQQLNTGWASIESASIQHETSVKRMLLVQFSCRERRIQAYLYERDMPTLKRLLADHSISLKE